MLSLLQVIMIASYGITALFMLISQSFLIFIVMVLYMVWILKLILIWAYVSFVLLANTIVNPFLSHIQSTLMICWILFILTFADLCPSREHNIVISLHLSMITHGIQRFSCLDKNLRRYLLLSNFTRLQNFTQVIGSRNFVAIMVENMCLVSLRVIV